MKLISLKNKEGNTKYTFWNRSFISNGKPLFSGIYSLTNTPSGKRSIKVVFPLPNGNATVILGTSVGANGELILESFGSKFNDPGFYFLLEDSRGKIWSKYLKSFRDQLIIRENGSGIIGIQKLTLWNIKVFEIEYEMYEK